MSDWLRWLLIALAVLAAVAVTVGRRRPRLTLPQVRARGGIAASVLVWLVIAIVVAGGTAGGLLWFFGWPHLPTAAIFDVTQLLDLLKIALSVVAGFGGVVLLAVNYRKQRVTENEHALAVEKAERETVQGFNERLGAAAEQLAHASPAVRLTGVYALAGLADDWVDKRQVCVDVLCGYLRLEPEVMPSGEAEVRQAILRIIRERTGIRGDWQRNDFDFTGMVFENADFSGHYFNGSVVFDRAEFAGELTTFAGSSFGGSLSCHGTRFAADLTTFASATFRGSTKFVGAEFVGRVLDWARSTVEEGSVDFYRCQVQCERLDFVLLSIRSGELRFEKLDFVDTDVDFADLDDGWSSEKTGFPRLVFEEVRFLRCRLRLEQMSDRDRERMVWFRDCVLDTVTVSLADLPGARPWLNLRDVELRGGTVVPERYLRRSAQERLDH